MYASSSACWHKRILNCWWSLLIGQASPCTIAQLHTCVLGGISAMCWGPQRGVLGTDDCGNWSQPNQSQRRCLFIMMSVNTSNQLNPPRSRLVMIPVVVESTNTTWCHHHYYPDYQRLYSLQLWKLTALKDNRKINTGSPTVWSPKPTRRQHHIPWCG